MMEAPNPAAIQPNRMPKRLLVPEGVLLDSEGVSASRSAVQFVGEGPVQRPVEVYVNVKRVLLNKLCGTYPVKLLPSTRLAPQRSRSKKN